MATGQQGFDPDDFVRRDREQQERAREQAMIASMRAAQEREQQRRRDRMADVVNDPNISVDQEMMKAINDPDMVMTSNGELAKVTSRRMASSPFANQFRRDKLISKPQKRRKKNPNLAAAFKEANRRMRTKSGKLRKGRTQGDIARLAHRLLKKM